MNQHLTVEPNDTIRLDMDWGFPAGIWIGNVQVAIHDMRQVDALIAACEDLRREREDRERAEAGELTEAEALTRDGVLTRRPVTPRELDRMYGEDAMHDRAAEETAREDDYESQVA